MIQTMLAALSNIANDIVLGPQNRKVKKYLDEATYDSVPKELGKVLSSQQRGRKERELLQMTFDKYCIQDSSEQKYWNEDSFRNHIRRTHCEVVISNPAIQLLWRSFHFYAYHPFPRDLQDGRVDFDAFQRAALLIVFQCNDLLGTRELEWFWRKDAAFFRKASFERLFRSIGVPETAKQPSKQQSHMASVLSDAMDVLIMVGPQFMHAAPSPDQLEIVARKLFVEGPAGTQREVRRKQVSTLMSLLLRMRLKKEKWGSFYNLGDFDEANPADEELIETLVNSLTENESEQSIPPEQLLRAIDLMPNLQLRFYQLWAVLFQPSVTTADVKLLHKPGAAPTHLKGVISLFAPQVRSEPRYHQRTVQQDERIALEKAETSPDSHNTTIARLVQALSNHSSAYVVLFTSDAVSTTPNAVVGAYFPIPLHITRTEAKDEKREAQANTSHLLFQLQPRFHLLQCTKPDVPLTDLIRAEGNEASLAKTAVGEGSESLNVPYWIGDPKSQGAGLRIDSEKKMATLKSGDEQWHKDVSVDGNDRLGKNWEVTIQNARMDIFTVTGGMDQELHTRRIMRVEDLPKHVLSALEPKVKGEELSKRIQGFGSS